MNWNDPKIERLIAAFLALKTADQAKRFLRDLMTEKEIGEFSRRLRAAEMLLEGTTYAAVEKETGLSSTTVARVAKWLQGKEGGYKIVLNTLHHHHTIRSRRGLS
jgi:TrpR-related protein YerC/YecD